MSEQLLNTASRHGFSISGLLDRTVQSVGEMALATTKNWTGSLAQAAALSFLKKIEVGQLRIVTTDGAVHICGESPLIPIPISTPHSRSPSPSPPPCVYPEGSGGDVGGSPSPLHPPALNKTSPSSRGSLSDTSATVMASSSETPPTTRGASPFPRFPPDLDGNAARRPGQPAAEIRVKNDAFWLRLCLMSDLGFSEAYMYGEIECDDLIALFEIFLLNKTQLAPSLDNRLSRLVMAIPHKLASYRFMNTLGNAQSNISAHYDISNEMFAGFLSPDMTYSCGIFDDLDGDIHGAALPHSSQSIPKSNLDYLSPESALHLGHKLSNLIKSNSSSSSRTSNTNNTNNASPRLDVYTDPGPQDALHAAQLRKLDHIISKARILPGHRVLEIGSGWGSLAIRIAQTVPGVAHIDTLTLSVQQQTLARARIAAAAAGGLGGLGDRIEVHLMDYRAMPREWAGLFDRVVSVEMMEAVGEEFLETYWKVLDWAMKKEDAVGVVQVITLPEARLAKYRLEIDFIRKWSKCAPLVTSSQSSLMPHTTVFPGAFIPTLTMLVQSLCNGSEGRLVIDSVSNIGPHYARTLREWRRRFEDAFESVIVPALEREYPDATKGPAGREGVEVFRRKWIYYYCYCEIGFTTRSLGDHIITFAREGYRDYGCGVYE